MYNKEFECEVSQYEIFHDLHLKVNDLLERSSNEYTKKLQGGFIAFFNNGICQKAGKITHITFKLKSQTSTASKIEGTVFYVDSDGVEHEKVLIDPFMDPNDLGNVATASSVKGTFCFTNCVISMDEDALDRELKVHNAE